MKNMNIVPKRGVGSGYALITLQLIFFLKIGRQKKFDLTKTNKIHTNSMVVSK